MNVIWFFAFEPQIHDRVIPAVAPCLYVMVLLLFQVTSNKSCYNKSAKLLLNCYWIDIFIYSYWLGEKEQWIMKKNLFCCYVLC